MSKLFDYAQESKKTIRRAERSLCDDDLSKQKKAMSVLYKAYSKTLYTYLSKKINNNCDLEDLSQQSWTKAFTQRCDYNYKSASFYTWLSAISKNLIKNYYRDKKHNSSLDAMEEAELNNFISNQLSLENQVDLLLIKEAIKLLNEKESRWIYMFFIDGFEQVEISKMEGYKDSTYVSRVIKRAIEKIRKALNT